MSCWCFKLAMMSTVTQWRFINIINQVSMTTPEACFLNFMATLLFITKWILYSYLFSVTSIVYWMFLLSQAWPKALQSRCPADCLSLFTDISFCFGSPGCSLYLLFFPLSTRHFPKKLYFPVVPLAS